MMKRALSAVLVAAASMLAVVSIAHCGGSTKSDVDPGADGAGNGNGSSGSDGTSSGGGNNTSSGEPGTSSGSSGSSGTGTSSSSSGEGPEPPKRIETKVGLPKRSAGCGNAAPPPNATRRTLEGGRQYLPYAATNYSSAGVDATAGYPVLVALHGCWGTPEGLATGFMRLQDYVGSEGIVVYGDDVGDGCNWDAFGSSDHPYLDAVIADVAAQYCVDESRVFMLGFSWGAYMAQAYACNRPGTIKAVVSTAGGYPDGAPGTDPAVCGQIPSLVYGRTHDYDEGPAKFRNARDKRKAIVSCNNGEGAAYWPFNAPGLDPSVTGCTDYYGCAGDLRTTFCEDPKDLRELAGSDYTWNHTFWDPYRRPVWDWLRNLP